METNDALAIDPARDDELIIVDMLDQQVATATKEVTHRSGLLHRAFSAVLLRDGENGPELLIAQRGAAKYHSAGLWANSCCSHPRVGEELLDAARRRIPEELGCAATDLRELTAFVYRAEFAGGLCEFEYDHVLIGRCATEPSPNPAEVEAVKWIGIDELSRELTSHPEHFAAWAHTVFSLVMTELAR